MTETTVAAVTAPTQAALKKKSPAGSKVKKTPAAHPTTSVMVTAAIKELKEKKGSSLPAIKKYLSANYKVDAAKLAPFIRKFLKAAVANGSLVQTNGSGASGHFKLAEIKKKQPAAKKPTTKKATKVTAPSAGKKRKSVAKKPKSSEPVAKKAKKTAVAAKPKTPKPKKASTKAAAKRAPAAKAKPPKAKKTPVKKTVAPKKK